MTMTDDDMDIPPLLHLTTEKRAAAWERQPPRQKLTFGREPTAIELAQFHLIHEKLLAEEAERDAERKHEQIEAITKNPASSRARASAVCGKNAPIVDPLLRKLRST